MPRSTGIRRLVSGASAALLISGSVVLLSAGVASARAVTIGTVASKGGAACTVKNPCGPKKSNFFSYDPPTNLVASTLPGSITLSWTSSQIEVVQMSVLTYTCTLLYGYNNPSPYTVTVATNSCTFYGLQPNTDYGVSVVAGSFPDESDPVQAFAVTPPVPATSVGSNLGAPSTGPTTTKKTHAPVVPVVESVSGTLHSSATAKTTGTVTLHGRNFYGHVTVWSNAPWQIVVKSVSSTAVVLSVTVPPRTQNARYAVTVVDPNGASTSTALTVLR